MINIIKGLKSTLTTISQAERHTIITICLTDFFLMMGYALCRPTAEGLFLEYVTNKYQPHCYLAIAIGCALFTAVFNKLLRRLDVTRLYAGSALLTAIIIALLTILLGAPATQLGAAFGLNVWKDIFIVILLEQVWGYCNLVFNKESATRIYSLFTAIGIIGSLLGNQLVSRLNRSGLVDPKNMLWLSATVIVISAVIFYSRQHTGEKQLLNRDRSRACSSRAGTAIISQSKYLRWMTLLVFSMQMVITLLDYQFKGMVEINFSGKSEKAAFFGSFYFYVNVLAFVMLIAAPPLLRKIGALRALWISPVILTVAAIALFFAPVFLLICGAMIVAKGLDYSLTKTAKEILYIPLTFEEKYKAKAVIDMFVYRVTKGISSGLLILLTALGQGTAFMALTSGILTMAALGSWFAALIGLKKTQP